MRAQDESPLQAELPALEPPRPLVCFGRDMRLLFDAQRQRYAIFHGGTPFFDWQAGDVPSQQWIVGQLVMNHAADRDEVAQAFGLDPETVEHLAQQVATSCVQAVLDQHPRPHFCTTATPAALDLVKESMAAGKNASTTQLELRCRLGVALSTEKISRLTRQFQAERVQQLVLLGQDDPADDLATGTS